MDLPLSRFLQVPLLAGGLCIGVASDSVAQSSGRFTFQPVEGGGIMRLDSETGHVSMCTRSGSDFACRSVADDRAAMEDEINRLRRENEELRSATGPRTGSAPKLSLPSDEELDKAMGLFEKMMRRMMRAMKDDGTPSERL